MGGCPYIDACGLSRNVSMRAALRVWQSFYCEGGYARCERYKLREAGHSVPDALLPNGRILETPGSSVGVRRASGA